MLLPSLLLSDAPEVLGTANEDVTVREGGGSVHRFAEGGLRPRLELARGLPHERGPVGGREVNAPIRRHRRGVMPLSAEAFLPVTIAGLHIPTTRDALVTHQKQLAAMSHRRRHIAAFLRLRP